MALLYVTFCCVFVTYPYGFLSRLWYLIVSITDLCLLPYFDQFFFLAIPWVGLRSVIVAFSGHINIFLLFHVFHSTGALARHVIFYFDI